MDKKQKLKLLANGFLGALAARETEWIPTDNISFEPAFMKAWEQWPQSTRTDLFPQLDRFGKDQPRMIVFRIVRSDSPFKDFRENGIAREPYGLVPTEFLKIWCDALPVGDWLHLADLYLEAVTANASRRGDTK